MLTTAVRFCFHRDRLRRGFLPRFILPCLQFAVAAHDFRMERVTVLLKGGVMPISAISKSCGYGTDAALRIAFRKRFGMSMRDWRKPAS